MFQLDDRRFNHLALAGLAAGFLLVLIAFAAAIWVFNANRASIKAVSHTYDVVDDLARLEVQIERAETARRGIILEPSAYRIAVFRRNVADAPRTLAAVTAKTGDNPTQVELGRRLGGALDFHIAEMTGSIEPALAGDLAGGRAIFLADSSAQEGLQRLRQITQAMRNEELKLLDERTAALERTVTTVQLALAATGLLLLLLGAVTFWLVRRYTLDLTATRDRLHVLNTDLEQAVNERTGDLQRANDEIQRFAYIVSHDLRSPLVNVMGFTSELERAHAQLAGLIDRVEAASPDLIDQDSRQAAKEDLPEAVGFIRASTKKMDRLINSILKLSREGRRTLSPEKLPMQPLLDDIAASFEQLLASRNARLLIEPPIPDLTSDRLAIEQIFSNLIENAIKYGRPDQPGMIEVSGARRGSRVHYEIRDNGRGIAPADYERIFDLFRRAGTQNEPGEGLGLAHVRALVHRLGGTIDLESVLGEGTTFRLSLPETFIDQGVRP